MPRLDGTGPNSEGPKTGRNRGYCEGSVAYGFRGRGCGRGNRGRRMGFGRGYNEESLNDRISFLESRLQELKELQNKQND